MPLPLFKVKEKSIYCFDKLFEALIAKYPWIEQYGYFKLYVTDRKEIDISDRAQLKKFRLETFKNVVKAPKEAPSGVFTFDRVDDGLKKGQTYDSYRRLIKEDPPVPFKDTAADPRRYIDDYWMHQLDGCSSWIERYAYAWNGSIFNSEIHKLNLAKLGNAIDNLNHKMLAKGINKTMLLIAGEGTSFPWHTEDRDLASILYHHFGDDKIWVFIHPNCRSVFEAAIKADFAIFYKSDCANIIKHKCCLTNLKWLDDHKIEYSIVRQEAGSYMIVLPAVYHSGYNVGWNVAQGQNFMCHLWAEQYKKHVACNCGIISHLLLEIDLEQFKYSGEQDIEVDMGNESATVYNESISKDKSLNDMNITDHESLTIDEHFTPVIIDSECSGFVPVQKRKHKDALSCKRGAPKKGPHVCECCGKIFQFQSKMENHQRQKSGKRDFNCTIGKCQKAYATKNRLAEHIKLIHKKKEMF